MSRATSLEIMTRSEQAAATCTGKHGSRRPSSRCLTMVSRVRLDFQGSSAKRSIIQQALARITPTGDWGWRQVRGWSEAEGDSDTNISILNILRQTSHVDRAITRICSTSQTQGTYTHRSTHNQSTDRHLEFGNGVFLQDTLYLVAVWLLL